MKTNRTGSSSLIRGAAPAVLSVALMLAATGLPSAAHAQGMPEIDGDEALRCAVQRAVDMAQVRQLHAIVAADPAALAALGDIGAGKTGEGDGLDLLAALGLVGDGGGLTALGERVLAFGAADDDSQAAVVLPLGETQSVAVDRPGGVAHLRLDTAGSAGETIVVVISPSLSDSTACAAGFDPVVRASLPGMPDSQPVARADGPMRTATLFLHNVADGAPVELTVADVVGAPGSFDVRAETWPAEAPAGAAAAGVLAVSEGPLAYHEVQTDGDRAVLAFSIAEGYEVPILSVRGLAGAQPGVTVFVADSFGEVSGDVAYRSAFVATPDATVDLGGALGPGYYAATIEDLAGRPATYIVTYSASGSGGGFRVAGTLEIGGESPQVLGSDLAFIIEEAGWYAFATRSYDEVDPVMNLNDSSGMTLFHSDDAAFGLHPLIIAELQPGNYTLSIDGFDGASGDITLGAWKFEPQTLELGTVGLEQEIANDLSQPNFNAYLIPVVANELVDIDVEGLSADFDSTLALYDTYDMTVWNADDDGGVGYGSRIIDSFDGLSLFTVVSSYDGARGGAFSISAVDHAKMENIETTALLVQPGGKSVAGSLAGESDIAWFRIDPMEGWHTLTVRSDAMPYLNVDLFVQQPDGYYWLDAMEGYDGVTELSFEGDPANAMFVLVRNPSGEGAGDFRVSVE